MLDDILNLRRAGFAIHILRPKSKIPLIKKWASVPVMSASELEEEYQKGDNAGVRLGKWSKVRGMFLYVVDMDIRDEKYLKQAENQVKLALEVDLDEFPTVISGSGGESRHFYFLSEDEFPSKKLWHSDEKIIDADGTWHWGAEVEFFGTGKQVAVPPSIHPDTGKPYRWERKFDENDLPVVDSDVIRAAVGFSDRDIDEESDKEPLGLSIKEAKEYLDILEEDKLDHESWRNVGMALHHEFGPKIGWILFDEWSKGVKNYDRQGNLEQFRAFKDKRHSTITMASIVQRANEISHVLNEEDILAEFESDPVVDEERDYEKEEKRHTGSKRDIVEAFGSPINRQETDINVSARLRGIPEHILTIPGALGIAVAHYNATSRMYQPQFAVQTCIALGSVLCSRHYVTQFDNYTSLYLMNVGETGAGKEYTRTFIRKALMETGLAGLIINEKYASDVGMISALFKKPRHISVSDEVGLVNSANSKDNAHYANVRAKMLSLFGDLGGTAEMPSYSMNGKSKGQLEDEAARYVVRPAMTYVGMSTPTTFYDSLSAASVEDGFLNRLLIVNTRLPRQMSRSGIWKKLPKPLAKWIKRYGKTGILEARPGEDEIDPSTILDRHGFNITEDPRQPDEPELVQFSDDALDRAREIEREVLNIQGKWKKFGLADMWVRAHELTLRISLIVALSCDSEEIEVEHLDWAWDYVNFYTNEMTEAAKSQIGSNLYVRLAEFFAVLIHDEGGRGMSESEMARAKADFKNMKEFERREVFSRLKTDHGVDRYSIQGKGGGRLTERFIHDDHAPKKKRRGRDEDLT